MLRIQLFITCLVDSFYPQTGEAIVDIFHLLGITVDFAPDQTCCGQPNFNAGLRVEARKIAEHTIRVFEKTTGDIVMPSGSCAHMIKHNYPELFADDPVWLPRAQSLGKRVYEFTEYLVDHLGVTDVGAQWNGTLTYHPSCHLSRSMNIDRQPRALLANVHGAQVVDLPHAEECCGFGGIFSMEHPELSAEWLKRKISNLEWWFSYPGRRGSGLPHASCRRFAPTEEETSRCTHRGSIEREMKPPPKINFVKVGNGQLALYHRPRNEDFPSLREMGCTHVITLLKESEGAERYGAMTQNAGMEWVWIPVPNGKYPEKDVHDRLIQAMPQLSQLLDDSKSILIHCSAGIHRTGTVAYGLLRWRGVDSKKAMKIIARTRRETAEGMLEKRMRWGDENARQPINQETPWIASIKEFVNHWQMRLFRSR